MKRLLALVAMVALAGLVQAGDYHYKDSLVCSDCHVMHATRAYNFSGNPPAESYNSGTGYDYLLKGATTDATCLVCHDGQTWAPDVFKANASGNVNRSGGALNDAAAGSGNELTYDAYDGHTLGSTATPPGGSALSDPLGCASCHNVHGYMGPRTSTMTDIAGNAFVEVNGSYRNLEPLNKFFGPPAIYVSYEYGTATNGADVYEVTQAEYDAWEVNLQEPTPTDSGFATWCGSCHGDFHGADVTAAPYLAADASGDGGQYNHFNKHPASTSNIGANQPVSGGYSSLTLFAGHNYRVRVMDPESDWGAPLDGTPWAIDLDTDGLPTSNLDLTATCLSCHKAHGTTQPFGLIYLDGAVDDIQTTAGENGSQGGNAGYRALCGQCHVQAE
jgi:hypothetical protein